MINENKRLKRWYEDNGFVNVGLKNYKGAPYTVGKMEYILQFSHIFSIKTLDKLCNIEYY